MKYEAVYKLDMHACIHSFCLFPSKYHLKKKQQNYKENHKFCAWLY